MTLCEAMQSGIEGMHLFHKQKNLEGGQFLARSWFHESKIEETIYKLAAIYGIMKHKVFRSLTFLNNDFNISQIFLFSPSNVHPHTSGEPIINRY